MSGVGLDVRPPLPEAVLRTPAAPWSHPSRPRGWRPIGPVRATKAKPARSPPHQSDRLRQAHQKHPLAHARDRQLSQAPDRSDRSGSGFIIHSEPAFLEPSCTVSLVERIHEQFRVQSDRLVDERPAQAVALVKQHAGGQDDGLVKRVARDPSALWPRIDRGASARDQLIQLVQGKAAQQRQLELAQGHLNGTHRQECSLFVLMNQKHETEHLPTPRPQWLRPANISERA